MRKVLLVLVCGLMVISATAQFVCAAAPKPGAPVFKICYGFGWASNGTRLKYGGTFAAPPVVITSAYLLSKPDYLSARALSSCAVDNSTTQFTMSIYDENGNPVTDAWVQWIAVTPMASKNVQGGIMQASDGQIISFPELPGNPVIVTNAQKGGKAILSGAASNTPRDFKLVLRDANGNSVQNAWVEWVAVLPGNQNSLRGAVAQMSTGASVTCSPAFLDRAIFVSSGQAGLEPYAAALWQNPGNPSNTGKLSLIRHDGTTGASIWTQWLAYGRQQ